MSENHVKNRFYCAVFYFDDLSKFELLTALRNMNIPILVSPVHNLDVWDEDEKMRWEKSHKDEIFPYELGMYKKEHVHVIFEMPYPKQPKSSLIYLNALLPSNLELNFILPVGFINLYCRYLCHLDNPDKVQYDRSEIINIHNFPENFDLPSTPRSKRSCRRDLMNCINSNKGISFSRLINIYLFDDDMMEYIERNCFFVKTLLLSEVNGYADKI